MYGSSFSCPVWKTTSNLSIILDLFNSSLILVNNSIFRMVSSRTCLILGYRQNISIRILLASCKYAGSRAKRELSPVLWACSRQSLLMVMTRKDPSTIFKPVCDSTCAVSRLKQSARLGLFLRFGIVMRKKLTSLFYGD